MKQSTSLKLSDYRCAWLLPGGADADVVISSRARLARNLVGTSFPNQAKAAEREELWRDICGAITGLCGFRPSLLREMSGISPLERRVLFERRLVSRELCDKGKGSGVAVDTETDVAILVNEEDHLRIQAICPGASLFQAWEKAVAVTDELEKSVEFAFDTQLGFLTACPSNVGSGLRVSAMVHLAGLAAEGEMAAIIRAAGKLGLAVRGIFGEGSEAVGHVFQFSNQSTLGESEEEIIARVESVVRQLVWSERQARERQLRGDGSLLVDQIGRAYGILQHARRLSADEATSHLCALRLGVESGLVATVQLAVINELLVLVQPGHLNLETGGSLTDENMESARAALIRSQLRNVT